MHNACAQALHRNSITMNGQNNDCPQYVFELPISEKFELNGEIHDLGEISTININAIEQYINSQLTEQLKADKVKIYGSNLTALDNTFERLSRLTGSITANIGIVESPISNWFFDIMKTPLGWIEYVFDKFSTALTIIMLVLAVIILFPVLEIGIVVWKVGYSTFSALASPIQRLSARWRISNARQLSRRRIKRYLTR